MASPSPPYEAFLVTWTLQPNSCFYEQGSPPREGRYVIAEQEGRLVFTIDWVDAEGARHHISFAGVPDGKPTPFAGGPLADAGGSRIGRDLAGRRGWTTDRVVERR